LLSATPRNEEAKRQELLKRVSKRLIHNDERVNRLTIEQLEFILSDINKASFLSSCPGSGKTEVVGFKVAYESSIWNSFYSGIAVLTFTRNAASEIWKRASEYSNQKAVQFPHFVGTIDSWLHQYIFQPFCYSAMGYEGKEGDTSINIIDSSSKSPFLETYKTITSFPPNYEDIKINQYYLTSQESINFHREYAPALTPTVERKLKENKLRFARSGFATYQDAEYWTYKLLSTNQELLELVAKRFPYIIIDECQDLAPSRLELLELLRCKGVILHFVGDLYQSIYDFMDVNPNLINEFIINSEMNNMKLTRNFRSNQEIVNFCAKLIENDNPPEGNVKPDNLNPCVLWEYQTESIHVLPSLFEKYLKSKNIDCSKCSILVRGHKLVNQLKNLTEIKDSASTNIAKAYFLYTSDSNDSRLIIESLNLLGKSICLLAYNGKGNHQNHYCPETFENIPWRLLLTDILKSSNGIGYFKNEDTPQTWSQWCASLKRYLKPYFDNLPNALVECDNAINKIKAPSGKANELVIASFTSQFSTPNIRITTIHDIKGETLDAAMLVSSATRHSRGGHFEDWLEDSTSEFARFAYVACSRPRDLLIIAVPSLTEAQKMKLESIGLVSEGLPGTLSSWF